MNRYLVPTMFALILLAAGGCDTGSDVDTSDGVSPGPSSPAVSYTLQITSVDTANIDTGTAIELEDLPAEGNRLTKN